MPIASTEQEVRAAPDDVEFETRLSAVRSVMAMRSLSALVVTDPANLFYLTGYDAWSFYTPQCLIVPADGRPHLFARAMDAAGAHYTANLPRAQVHGYPEVYVHRPDLHPFEWITAKAREIGLLVDSPDSWIAVEGDSHFFSARGYLAMAGCFQYARLTESFELVNWVRLVKSEHELSQLRVAGSIAERVMQVALAAIDVDRRHCDVVAEILAAQAAGTPEHGGDYPAIVPMLPTGESAGTPHLTWTDARFVEGEATTVELAGVFGRYHAPLARTVCLGQPSRRLSNMAGVIKEGMAAALDTVVPGVTAGDVHTAFNSVISRHGFTKESRIGYSIGIGYPPDWGERTVSLRAEAATVLQPGMAFHVILGMWMDGWGYELSEPIIVTDAGAERLTNLPQELTVRR